MEIAVIEEIEKKKPKPQSANNEIFEQSLSLNADQDKTPSKKSIQIGQQKGANSTKYVQPDAEAKANFDELMKKVKEKQNSKFNFV